MKLEPDRDVRDALERIINLYEAWGKPEEAARWRAKLPESAAGKERCVGQDAPSGQEESEGPPDE